MFLDVGELGWSFYLSAHMRWLKEQDYSVPAVMVLPGRECLYEDITDFIYKVPSEFFVDFDMTSQNRFTLYGVNGTRLRAYFDSRLPMDHFVSETQPFDCHVWKHVYVGKMIFKPYFCRSQYNSVFPREILIFPRHRDYHRFRPRNLPKIFYVDLINRLCDEFKDYIIRIMGTKEGAYNITEVKKNNCVNFVGETPGIQALIDRSQIAIGAVGSQSAPLKLMMLQGVSSFMIGHEQGRHTEVENWSKTEAGFWAIDRKDYNNFNSRECIDEIVEFFKK